MVITALAALGIISTAGSCSAAVTFQIIRDNNATAIDYEPPESWKHLPGDCDGCIQPPSNLLINSGGTYTNGTNALRKFDNDDFVPKVKGKGKKKRTALLRRSRTKRDDDDDKKKKDDDEKSDDSGSDNDGDDEKEDDDNDDKDKDKKPSSSSSSTKPTPSASTSAPDADDSNSIPTPVTVTFRFSGSAFTLHALVPSFVLPDNAPSLTNVSFMLDGISTGPAFTFTPTKQGQEFQDTEVLRLNNLGAGKHVVVGSLAPGSTLIVSYVNLTMEDDIASRSGQTNGGGVDDTSTTSLAGSAATGTTAANTKKNVTSFAGIIGSVVGVLTILALSTCLSLCFRRRKARKRLALIRAEEEQAEIREFGARLIGPRPFQPRYFPGTLPPFDPEELEDEPSGMPPPYENPQGTQQVMISPLPPPPPPPPPPPIFSQTSSSSFASTPSLVVAPGSSPPPDTLPAPIEPESISVSVPAGSVSTPATIPLQSQGQSQSQETDERTPTPTPSSSSTTKRVRPPRERREDETSDCELGGLLPRGSRTSEPDTASESESGTEDR